MNWVTATDLKQWAPQRQFPGLIPKLLQKLIWASLGPSVRFHFPTGDSIQSGGWDGVVIEAPAGCGFVPEGFSAWEIGCESNTKGKADDDYKKRTENPLGADPAQTTFVFVSPRAFQKKDEWTTEKREDKIWKDVQALNADDLEAWLDQTQPVAAWLARQMGKVPQGVMALDDFWEEWSKTTNPPVSFDLVLAGREKQAGEVVAWLSGGPSSFKVQSDSPNEAIAFLIASIEQVKSHDQKGTLLSRCLITEDIIASRALAAQTKPWVLIMNDDNTDSVGQAVHNGHHVYIPLSNVLVSSHPDLKLPPPSREGFVKALEEMGYDHGEAQALMKTFGRSLTVFQRQCATGGYKTPPWAESSRARPLLPALIAGCWSEKNDADKACLSVLAGSSYEDFEAQLTPWQAVSDSPLQKIASVWAMRSRKDSWFLLACQVTQTEWEKFFPKALEVLGVYDPRYDLEPNERYAAAIHGKVLTHSDFLRRGIAETLVCLAVFGKDAGVLLSDHQDFCNAFVRDLLKGKDWTRWASLSRLLPMLAEAAPEAFLDAVEESLQQPDPPLAKLFMDTKEQQFILSPDTPHPCLLFALENIAWYPEYLPRVAMSLGHLDALDPGGTLMNRPDNSLIEIFSIYWPGTIAPWGERLKILDVLNKRYPETGWKTMLSLITQRVGHPTHKPDWRPIPSENTEEITMSYVYQSACDILDKALLASGNTVSRWKGLVDHLSELPETKREAVVKGLENLCKNALSQEDGALLRDSLRSVLNRHRWANQKGLDWALPVSLLDDLEAIYDELEPEDVATGSLWLFKDYWIDLPQGDDDDYNAKTQKVREVRSEAAQKIYDQGGVDLLLDFASQVIASGVFGQAAADALSDSNEIDEIINRALNAGTDNLLVFCQAFVTECFRGHGWSWADSILNRARTETWPPQKLAGYFQGLPQNKESWERLEQQDSTVQGLYWSKVRLDFRDCSNEETTYGVEKLMEAKRPYTAFFSIRFELKKLTSNTIMALLELVAKSSPQNENIRLENMFGYKVGKCFKQLYEDESADKNKILNLEWMYLPLLARDLDREHRPQLLLKSIEDSPADFATLVKWIYKRDDDGEDEDDISPEQMQNRARAARDLMDVWKKEPGFLTDQGDLKGDKLKSWVTEVLKVSEENHRTTMGESSVGEMLAYTLPGQAGVWPQIAIRDIIEEFATENFERGLETGLHNKRGVTSRGMYEGGAQERELAEAYKSWANLCRINWPKTAKVLTSVANFYERYGKHEDHESELRDLE